ncbi:MAG TPA: high frequency lysogenization protein HflD [Arenimonas sp.]|nr:high frequency lysogenization protein HflD [Arenimonas sp.]
MKDRTLALAGLLQAIRCVQLLANTGQSETQPLNACIESLFRFDAETAEAIYGGAGQLESGLKRVISQIAGPDRDPTQTRMAMTVLQLERRFIARPASIEAIRKGLEDIARQREHFGPTHPTVLARLGELYAQVISPIGPRVLVQGNPAYLAQPQLVGEVRAGLLAAVRAAVLWRQLGGSYWDFLFSRHAMVNAARQWLESSRA